MINPKLFQPVFSRKPEPGHTVKALTFDRFIELLRQEEDYYQGEQRNTKLMITRLRKIFYNSWGWSTQVIRKAAKISCRYQTKMVPVNQNTKGKNQSDNSSPITQLTYKVTYTKNDKIYPERAGETPEIYAHDDQEIITPQGYYCDIGHILSGIDAYNNFAPISPLPNWLFFMRFLFPIVNSNMDFATWLGDIASASGDFLIDEINKKKISEKEEQETIDDDDPGSDVIGNIDSYAIKDIFDTTTSDGLRVTEILETYFGNEGYLANTISVFCSAIGLKNLDGNKFSNEKEWIRYYKSQLRNATAFYVFGEVGKLKGLWLALKIWLRFYEKVMTLEILLQIFIDALKKEIIYEQKKTNQ